MASHAPASIAILCAVVFWGHHQTPPLACSSIDSLHNVNELLLVCQRPVDLVVVTYRGRGRGRDGDGGVSGVAGL